MTTVRLNLRRRRDPSYSIDIGEGIFPDRLKRVLSDMKPTRVAVVTDSNVGRIYGRRIRNALKPFSPVLLTFPAGEKNKNAGRILSLFPPLIRNRLDRRSVIVAIGGGVTGDMAGFLSSLYLRGIPFVQVPTTLLAMVDSSIGGKTGVDTPAGKNLMGAFHQPAAVIIDPLFLKTLPSEEFQNGLAEVVKHAAIRDRSYFRFLRENAERILALDPGVLTRLIEWSCRIKASVVTRDERESGLRQVLNFGHTLGHAVEQASGYRIPHGFAVALGMAAEGWIAVRKGILAESEWTELAALCARFGLGKYRTVLGRLSGARILSAAAADKKNTGRDVRCVFLGKIGRVTNGRGVFSYPVTVEEMKAGLKRAGETG